VTFSSYWKEIAVVLAALFAIGSVISDVKDKRTERYTIWGRTFLILTLLSMAGGLYAQWTESAEEDQRNKTSQAAMIKLLDHTEQSIRDLARVLQRIDAPRVTVFLSPDCGASQTLQHFCESLKREGRREANDLARKIFNKLPPTKIWGQAISWPPGRGSSFTLEKVDWPKGLFLVNVNLHFFKNNVAVDQLFEGSCLLCVDGSDMDIDLLVFAASRSRPGRGKSSVSVNYTTGTEELSVILSDDLARPRVHSDQILSVVDLWGSTLIVENPSGLLDGFAVTHIFIDTPQGQSIEAAALQPVKVGDTRIFVYHFPKAPARLEAPKRRSGT
jgi:hypothetical protein